jgi:hypothetical protein
MMLRDSVHKPAWTSTDLHPGVQKGQVTLGQRVFLRTRKAIFDVCRLIEQKSSGFVVGFYGPGPGRDNRAVYQTQLVGWDDIRELRPYAD